MERNAGLTHLPHLRSAFTYCKQVVKKSAGNFFLAFQLLPRTKRYAIYSVYAFCRAADDAVDELPNPSLRRISIEMVKRALERVYRGDPRTPIEVALSDTVGRFRLSKKYFDDLLVGMENDIDPVGLNNRDELDEYCYRAAGTVGLLCLEIFGVAGNKARRYAISLGRALQLTNILRDLRADALQGRVYVPKEMLEEYGVTVEDITMGRGGEQFESLAQALIALAKTSYADAEKHRPRGVAARLITSEAMRKVYRALLSKIESNPNQVLEGRVSISNWKKAGLVLSAVTNR